MYNMQETSSHHANSNKPVTNTHCMVPFTSRTVKFTESESRRMVPGILGNGWQQQANYGETFLHSLNGENSKDTFI